MMNDFEVILWVIWLKLVPFPEQESKVVDFLQIIALYVKQENNDKALYKIFETFYSHNYPEFFARFRNSPKPDVKLSSADINKHFKTLNKTFEYKTEKEIKDYNYEVDALEAEHDKREVHTTTKFEEEKLKKMEEEAKKSNQERNYGKRKPSVIEETQQPLKKVKRVAKEKMKQEEQEESKEKEQNVTVGNICSVKGSSSGENQVQMYIPTAFKPPSYKNNKGEASGLMQASNEGRQASLLQPGIISNSNSLHQFKGNFESLFRNFYNNGNLENKEKSGLFKFIPGMVSGASNPNSADIGSLNIALDNSKVLRSNLRAPSDGSFHSILPEFSKKGSQSIIFQNKSGSLEGKINGFIGAQGSFINPNVSKHPPDNQK